MQTQAIKKKSLDTKEVLNRIFRTKNIKNFLIKNSEHLNVPSLNDYLSELCHLKNKKPKEVLQNADIPVVYGRDIFSGKRKNPTRDYALRLAFGFGLDYNECQKLLAVAKLNALYPKVKRDAAIIKCLQNKMSYHETEQILLENGMSPLSKDSVKVEVRGEIQSEQ